jgi:predicted Zn-dependent protease
MFVSESQEIEIGKEFYPSALWGDVGGGGEFRDERLKAYLKDIVLRIHAVSHRPNLPVDFAIQNSSIPNAWAIPGHVVITRGLLAGLENEAEFAFVMGHEMGHVAARHSASQMTYGMLQQIGLGAAGVALGSSEYAGLAMNVGAIGSTLLLLKYSRSDELEADELGIQYMSKLGYDPTNAIDAHKRLEKLSRDYAQSVGKNSAEGGFFQELLSTHPRTSVRIDEIKAMIRRIPAVRLSGDGTNKRQFQNKTERLRSMNELYLNHYDKATRAMEENELEEAEALIDQAIRKDGTQAPFYTLKGFVKLKKKEYSPAEKSFHVALSLDKGYAPAYRGLGMVHYSQEKYSDGIQYLEKGLSIFPDDVVSHYVLGLSYYKLERSKQAIPHLNVLAKAQPKHPEIHGILGICYENINDISSAYNEYVKQLQVEPNNEVGRHAAQRVAVLRPYMEQRRSR